MDTLAANFLMKGHSRRKEFYLSNSYDLYHRKFIIFTLTLKGSQDSSISTEVQ